MTATIPHIDANTNLLKWIAAAKVERRAYRAWRNALPLAPIKLGWERETGSVWQPYVDSLRAEHAAARDTLDALSYQPSQEQGTSMDTCPNEIIEDLRVFNGNVHVKRDRDRYGWTFHSGRLATDWDGLVARVRAAEARAAELHQQVARLSVAVVQLTEKVDID